MLAAVVEYRTPHRRLKRGVATGWLARLAPHPSLPQARFRMLGILSLRQILF